MGKFSKRLKKGLKKVGRAVGGPVTGIVDGARAVKKGKGAFGALRAFGKSVKPGRVVEATYDVTADLVVEGARKVAGDEVAGRVRTFARVIRPSVPAPDPIDPLLSVKSAIAAAAVGDWRRAGRTVSGMASSAVMRPAIDGFDRGQAIGDLFDNDSSRALDDDLIPYLKRIFGNSIDYDAIEINPGRPGWGRSTDAITFPGVIYMGGTSQFTTALGATVMVSLGPEGMVAKPSAKLVHELVHVWQNQQGGPRYLVEAVGGYAAHGTNASYRWWNFTDANREYRIDNYRATQGAKWRDLPVEPQAEFIMDAFNNRAFETGSFPWFGGFALNSTMLRYFTGDPDPNDQASYEAAFGAGNTIDWSVFLREAIKSLHDGDFRF